MKKSNNEFELSLVAPCLNEEENVGELARRFLDSATSLNVASEVVFVDDGSTDLTWIRIQELAAEFPGQVRRERHSTNRGIPHAWITGVEASRGRLVCLIDSDLQNPPEAVFELYDTFIRSSVDLVRGVRRAVATQSISRIVMSRSLNFLLNFVFGMNSRDNKSGFILGPKDVLQDIIHHQGHYRHFQTFVGVAAHSKQFTVVEIVTPFEDRRHGTSFLSGKSYRVIKEVLSDIPAARREFGIRFSRRNLK